MLNFCGVTNLLNKRNKDTGVGELKQKIHMSAADRLLIHRISDNVRYLRNKLILMALQSILKVITHDVWMGLLRGNLSIRTADDSYFFSQALLRWHKVTHSRICRCHEGRSFEELMIDVARI